MRACLRVSVCVHACVRARARARVCVCVCVCVCTQIDIDYLLCVYTYIDIDYLLCISKLHSHTRGHTSMREERTDRSTSFACMRFHIYNKLLFERTVM